MYKKREGMTLVEVILALALLGIVSVSFLGGFSSQLMNINRGTDITAKAMEAQADFELIVSDVRTQIQDPKEDDPVIPEWYPDPVEVLVLGKNIEMQKISKSYADDLKDNTLYLSKRLAEIEKNPKITVDGVMIDVSSDVDNLVADLTLSPLPTLKAEHNDNSDEPEFYVNLYRWWRSVPGKEYANLVWPDDFSVISVSQTTDILTNLLDNVGAGRYVALTVTPVDIHGNRGDTIRSSNYVYIKGAEWRIGSSPWADTNNNYVLDGTDVMIGTDRIKEALNATIHTIPNQMDPDEMLSIEDSSLFVPMNVDPASGQMPGTIPIQISGTETIDWSIENNINLAKDFEVNNASQVKLTAGTGGNGGSIYLYPYLELDTGGNPIYVSGVPKIIDYGSSIKTDGNITLKTMSRGNIELLDYNHLEGNNISLEARGSIVLNNSSLLAESDIIFDTSKNPEISGARYIRLEGTTLSSTNPNSQVIFNSADDLVFKGGGWSSNQTLVIPNYRNILFGNQNGKVDNLGIIDMSDTGRMFFQNSMNEDLTRRPRLLLDRESNDSFKLSTIYYLRNLNYANPSSNQEVAVEGLWNRLGSGNHNFEFSTRVMTGPGSVHDLSYSYEGNGIIRIDVVATGQTADTRIKFDVRDRYNNEIVGSGYFIYSIDNSGNSTIEVEEALPLDYYTITFDTDGGTYIAPIGGIAGESVGVVEDPTKLGHKFMGWDKALPSTIPDYNLDLKAIWEAIEYEIRFDSNGGPAISTIKLKYKDPISLTPPTWDGYGFQGWSPEPPATMPAHDLELKALWLENSLTVSFNPMGGIPSPSSMVVVFNSEYGTLPVVERDEYIFAGWYTSETGGDLVKTGDKVTNPGNHILYAQWISKRIPVEGIQILDMTDENEEFKSEVFVEVVVRNTPSYFNLETRFIPENASNKNVSWASDNDDLATVSNDGHVTLNPDRTGTVILTVTTEDGNHTARLTIVVISDSGGCWP